MTLLPCIHVFVFYARSTQPGNCHSYFLRLCPVPSAPTISDREPRMVLHVAGQSSFLSSTKDKNGGGWDKEAR